MDQAWEEEVLNMDQAKKEIASLKEQLYRSLRQQARLNERLTQQEREITGWTQRARDLERGKLLPDSFALGALHAAA